MRLEIIEITIIGGAILRREITEQSERILI